MPKRSVWMMGGFNPKEHLWCEGIIGDGCGGGRIFFIDEGKLFAYEPNTQEQMLLDENIIDAQAIAKKGCHITIECKGEKIVFDLSSLKRV